MQKLDLFRRTAEQSTEPLSVLGWIGCSGDLSACLFGCVLASVLFSGRKTSAVLVTSGVLAYGIFVFTSPMYRAITPGHSVGWWVLTGCMMVAVVGVFIVANDRVSYELPNPLPGVLAPVGGIVLAIALDAVSERLINIPQAWMSFLLLIILGMSGLILIVTNRRQ